MLGQYWSDNEYTAEGSAEHEIVHNSRIEKRNDEAKMYEAWLFSDKLKLVGKSDCIEFAADPSGAYIDELGGHYTIYPVEYKHGRVRDEIEYNMQLCAQAICLEEMYSAKIGSGAIFYIDAHRRSEVIFDDELRDMTVSAAEQLGFMLSSQKIPVAVKSSKCKKCSLVDICMPGLKTSARAYVDGLKNAATQKPENE